MPSGVVVPRGVTLKNSFLYRALVLEEVRAFVPDSLRHLFSHYITELGFQPQGVLNCYLGHICSNPSCTPESITEEFLKKLALPRFNGKAHEGNGGNGSARRRILEGRSCLTENDFYF
jgi:hypothetical protein